MKCRSLIRLFCIKPKGALTDDAESADVSAVSTGSQIMATLTNIISSLCMGMTIFLGQKIGEKRADEGGKIVGSGLVLFSAIGCFMTMLIPLMAPKFAMTMHASEHF